MRVGRVTGLESKFEATHKAGLTRMIVPAANDLSTIDRPEVTSFPVGTVDEAVDIVVNTGSVLRTWLEAMREHVGRLPQWIEEPARRYRPELEPAEVRRRLNQPIQLAPWPADDIGGPAAEPIRLTDLVDQGHGVIRIIADGGGGKTWALGQLALDLVDRADKALSREASAARAAWPVFAEVPKLMGLLPHKPDPWTNPHEKGEVVQAVVKAAADELGLSHDEKTVRVLQDRLACGGSVVLLLDEFNQVQVTRAEEARGVVELLAPESGATDGGVQLVLAGRETRVMADIKQGPMFKILPFGEDELEHFVTSWADLTGIDGGLLRGELRRPGYRTDARWPLFLTMCCVLFLNTKKLPSNTMTVYTDFLNRIMSPNSSASNEKLRTYSWLEDRRSRLGEIAWIIATTDDGWMDSLPEQDIKELIDSAHWHGKKNIGMVLKEFAEQGLLKQQEDEDKDGQTVFRYGLFHQRIAEYLIAYRLLDMPGAGKKGFDKEPNPGWKKGLDEELNPGSSWEQVVSFLAASVPEPWELIRYLVGEFDRDPHNMYRFSAGQALAQLPRADIATTDEDNRRLLDRILLELEVVLHSTSEYDRLHAAELLGHLGDAGTKAAWRCRQTGRDVSAAVRTFVTEGSPQSLNALAGIVRDQRLEESASTAALEGLASSRDGRALELLKELAWDTKIGVRRRVAAARVLWRSDSGLLLSHHLELARRHARKGSQKESEQFSAVAALASLDGVEFKDLENLIKGNLAAPSRDLVQRRKKGHFPRDMTERTQEILRQARDKGLQGTELYRWLATRAGIDPGLRYAAFELLREAVGKDLSREQVEGDLLKQGAAEVQYDLMIQAELMRMWFEKNTNNGTDTLREIDRILTNQGSHSIAEVYVAAEWLFYTGYIEHPRYEEAKATVERLKGSEYGELFERKTEPPRSATTTQQRPGYRILRLDRRFVAQATHSDICQAPSWVYACPEAAPWIEQRLLNSELGRREREGLVYLYLTWPGREREAKETADGLDKDDPEQATLCGRALAAYGYYAEAAEAHGKCADGNTCPHPNPLAEAYRAAEALLSLRDLQRRRSSPGDLHRANELVRREWPQQGPKPSWMQAVDLRLALWEGKGRTELEKIALTAGDPCLTLIVAQVIAFARGGLDAAPDLALLKKRLEVAYTAPGGYRALVSATRLLKLKAVKPVAERKKALRTYHGHVKSALEVVRARWNGIPHADDHTEEIPPLHGEPRGSRP